MTDPFHKSLQEASASAQRFGDQVNRIAGAYIGFEAAKVAAGHLKELAVGTIEAVSASKILAERVGMSSESFQKLAYAAKLAHEDQDGFATSLGQMNKRLAEVAIEGSGPAADALRRFGLSARQVVSMGTEGAFFKLMTVMEGIKNPAERAAVAMDLFGKSGQGMINMAARGSADLHSLGDDASRMGVAISDLDTAKVEEADQAFLRLGSAFQGIYNSVATELAPILVEVIDKSLEWGFAGTSSASIVSQGMEWVVDGFGRALDAGNAFKSLFHYINVVLAETVSYFLAGIDRMLEGVDWLVKKLGGDSALAGSLKELSSAFEVVATHELDAAESAWAKVGAGKGMAHTLVDDIKRRADERAGVKVAESAKLTTPGLLTKAHVEKVAFGGALELGSKDAYSAIVRSMVGGMERTEQRKIAANTQRAAGAGERSAAFLEKIANAQKGKDRPLTPAIPGF